MQTCLQLRRKITSKHQTILSKKQKLLWSVNKSNNRFSTRWEVISQISNLVVTSWIMKLRTKVSSLSLDTHMISLREMLSWPNRGSTILKWVMRVELNSQSRRRIHRMDISYHLQQCQDKEAKILVNQTDTQCKLVPQGMHPNSNQQQWLNKHRRAKIWIEKKSSMVPISSNKIWDQATSLLVIPTIRQFQAVHKTTNNIQLVHW